MDYKIFITTDLRI